ncbi:hypothetical protein [uncultured Corynebacterium sp.]|nr:hypothetical protein [uncultured Corynebacterium sp.]
MPFDLKSAKKALETFATFAKNLSKLFTKTPKTIKDFADKVSK